MWVRRTFDCEMSSTSFAVDECDRVHAFLVLAVLRVSASATVDQKRESFTRKQALAAFFFHLFSRPARPARPTRDGFMD